MAYLTQAQAAVYAPNVGTLDAAIASALLEVASTTIDNACGRTFDTVLEELPTPIAMAVALMTDELSNGVNAGRDVTSERIGDYAVTYENKVDAYSALPSSVALLIAPYRIVVCG